MSLYDSTTQWEARPFSATKEGEKTEVKFSLEQKIKSVNFLFAT